MAITTAERRADQHGRGRARELGGVSVAALVVLAVGYLLLVRTAVGQTLDDQALVGRLAADPAATRGVGDLLRTISRSTVVLMALVLVLVGLARRRVPLAVTAAATFIGAVVSAEVLKAVLPRPDLVPEFDTLLATKLIETYPSGHATIATAFVLALVMVSSSRWRPWVGLLGLGWCTLVAAGTVAAGWHRPSDAVGGIALATCWLAGAAAALCRRQGQQVPEASSARLLPWGAAVAGMVVVTGLAVALVGGRAERLPAAVPAWVFPTGQLLVDVAAIAAVGSVTWLLRDVRFGAPSLTGRG